MAEITHQFTVGQQVSFERNFDVKSEGTPIIALVPKPQKQEVTKLSYVIEHEMGWTPHPLRAHQLGLDITKKYLFVEENELTLVE